MSLRILHINEKKKINSQHRIGAVRHCKLAPACPLMFLYFRCFRKYNDIFLSFLNSTSLAA